MFLHATEFVSDKHKLFYIARSYASSFFHQSWNVFVPPPDTNYKLFAEFECKGLQKKEVFNDMLLQHQSNRLKGYETLVVAFSNTIYFFEKSTVLQKPMNGPISNDINFTMIEHATKNYLQDNYKAPVQKLKLILVVENIETKQQKVYFN